MDRTDKILIAVDDSEASLKAVSYVTQMLRGRKGIHVRLLHVLPAIPPELLEFGGAEDPQSEQRLSADLKETQARWLDTAQNHAQPSLDKARAILLNEGLSPDEVSTTFSSSIHQPDVAREIVETAKKWNCGTLVVGRHTHSWIKELTSKHVGEELVRRGQGFAIWVVE